MSAADFSVHGFSTLDSTSSEAARRLAAGEKPPFAVTSRTQSKGRGRRGNSWESFDGNLHMTLALPLTEAPPTGELSLKAAVLVARFLQRAVSVRVTLKWPNDILFGGKKLGGLLLEGIGNAVLVGVGLNLVDAPEGGVSLALLRQARVDCAELATKLARYLHSEWTTNLDVPQAFSEFAIENGQLWQEHGGGKFAATKDVTADGSLLIGEERLSSVDHRYGWIYQAAGAARQPLLVADLGNTSAKVARFEHATDQEPAFQASVPWTAHDHELARALARAADGIPFSPWPLHILSVSRAGATRLQNLAPQAGLSPLLLPKRPLLWRGRYEISEMGADRLAAIEACLAARLRGDWRGDLIVIAAGTATTMDALSSAGEHLGGLILPGFGTALKSLHQATSLLPALEPMPEPVVAPGLTTASAMQQAALMMTVGAARMLAESVGFSRRSCDIVVTGGLAPILYGKVAPGFNAVHVAPHLMLLGAKAMARGGDLG